MLIKNKKKFLVMLIMWIFVVVVITVYFSFQRDKPLMEKQQKEAELQQLDRYIPISNDIKSLDNMSCNQINSVIGDIPSNYDIRNLNEIQIHALKLADDCSNGKRQ